MAICYVVFVLKSGIVLSFCQQQLGPVVAAVIMRYGALHEHVATLPFVGISIILADEAFSIVSRFNSEMKSV